VAESINKVTHDGDVTRHAEVAAISQAQKTLGTVSLEDCEIYLNAEPCALCSYAIRETRKCSRLPRRSYPGTWRKKQSTR
jgi:tRNA(adenine34) deaminase